MKKKTFISYSWDNEEHTEWVLNLADALVKYGLDIILDQYDLSVGHEMTHFMEKAMLADKIIVIMTPNYKIKADNRQGGVGYEYSMLTKELFEQEPDQTRIIPILKSGNKENSCPSFLQTRIFHDMTIDEKFDAKFFELTKLIQDKPLVKKPQLGILKEDEDSIPDLEKKITDFQAKENLIRRKKMFLNSSEGVNLFTTTAEEIISKILQIVENYRTNFGFHFHVKTNNISNILISTVNYTFYFQSNQDASNSAEYASIQTNFFQGPVGLDYGIDYRGQTEVIYRHKYKFSLDENLKPIFIREDNPNIIILPEEVSTIGIRDVITKEINLREKRLE
ncbi:toll/interleukin-1 receptor domain-containing protein [Flavobacterium sp. UBA7682]|uniref:toll/interleukin-1 receptor domain-containing protein n=1 Tax=Flavobacterium sp. UBA7682 TaxID=1946560 RepID=UPI0025BFFF78|nr:toll/interleukin-1 receptor domain-containing protein [Flavobacterium sp. UBA7682]